MQKHRFEGVAVVAHSRDEVGIQADARMQTPKHLVGRRNHLHHAARTRGTDRIAIGVEFVQGEQRVDFAVERAAILAPEAVVIDVFDDAEPLGDVHDLRRDNLVLILQTLRREVEHRADVRLPGLDEFGRHQSGMRRRVVGHLAERPELLDRVFDDERHKLSSLHVGDDDGRVDVIRADDLQAHVHSL
ncbi:MAG TPA: hypothetical protein VM934_12685 [Pyrinomonadaceae bacterium]|nr:hypothetical protein [Pyrinomonadaceae bacterium]